MRKIELIISLLIPALSPLLMTSCTNRGGRDASTLTTVVIALSAPPSTIDPRFTTDATGSRLSGLLFSALVRTGPDLQPVPDAALSWTVDGALYVFKLRPGLKFSNGRELTADDLRFSVEQVRSAASPFKSSFSGIRKVQVRYDDTARELRLELDQPSATFLTDLNTLKILPKIEIERAPDAFARAPIGTGPFAFESWEGDELHLRARSDHPYAAPKIERAVFKIVRDDNTRAIKMQRGEIDLAQAEFPPLKVRALEKSQNLKVYAYPGLAMTYLLVNHSNPILRKLNVRRAISRAIDRDAIAKYKLEGLAQPATSLLTPANPFFNANLKTDSFSVSEAKRLLMNESGLGLELKTSNVPTAVDNGKIIARELADVGLPTTLRSYEWATYYADIQAGRFQLAIMRWVGTIDPDLYRKAFHSREIPPLGRNRGQYSNSILDPLLEKGIRTTSMTERIAVYRQIQQIIYDDLAIIPLWYDTEVAVASRRLQNYVPTPDGSFWPLTQINKTK